MSRFGGCKVTPDRGCPASYGIVIVQFTEVYIGCVLIYHIEQRDFCKDRRTVSPLADHIPSSITGAAKPNAMVARLHRLCSSAESVDFE